MTDRTAGEERTMDERGARLRSRTSAPLLAALLASNACLSVDLDGRPCPCIDGYRCVDGMCVGEEGDVDAGSLDAGGLDDGGCPARFTPDQRCGANPPASGALVRLCNDGATMPSAVADELGSGLGFCFGPPAVASVTSDTLAGSISFTSGGGSATLHLELTGSAVYRVDLPAECTQESLGCPPSDGSGVCDVAGDGCACTGVTVDHATTQDLDAFDGRYTGEDDMYFGCAREGVFLLREELGDLLGPILVFAPAE